MDLFDWTVERGTPPQTHSGPLDDKQGCDDQTRASALAVDARYRALVRNLPDAVVSVHDRELRGVSIDGPILARVGFSPERFEGVTLHDLLGPDDYERLAPHYLAALKGETSSGEFFYSRTGTVYQ